MLKSPVSILQELMTQRKLPPPVYTYQDTETEYNSHVKCHVDIGVGRASATGASRKAAKHNAAVIILECLGIKTHGSDEVASICLLPTPAPKHIPTINFIGKLNEFSSGHKLPHATYIHKEVLQNLQFCVTCHFLRFTVEGFGHSKKTAKQDAAKQMLQIIQKNSIADIHNQLEVFGSNQTVVPPSESAVLEIDEALRKYTDIVNSKQPGIHNEAVKVFEGSRRRLINFYTWNELEGYLVSQGYAIEVTVFQKQPLMLCLKVNEYTFLNFGRTSQEILQKFIPTLMNMLDLGTHLKKPYNAALFP